MPATATGLKDLDVTEWEQDPGTLVVPDAGEILSR